MTLKLDKLKDRLLFLPLGGANEIGMNLNLYHYQGKWLMVDMGIGFADEYLPGIDIILPNIDFIVEHKDEVAGLVITHAHEDHLGGVPYLWQEIGCPIYATPFCAAVLREKMNNVGIKSVPVTEVNRSDRFHVGPFDVELVGITHSIPEMCGLAIRTDAGTIMHTGDWKLDPEPLVGLSSDEARLKEIGDEGVLALVCDSTNVFVEGVTGSEATARHHLVEVIKSCKERVVVTTFASNVARLESILLAAKECNRKVALIGRSLWRIIGAAQKAGYLQDAPEFIEERSVMSLPRNEVLIISTGCQGEPLAAMSKFANNEHPFVKLAPNDTAIFSSRVIPGNEKRLGWIFNKLVQNGIEVITGMDHELHVSGHPARDELKQMYELVRPAIAVPVHGEPRHLHEHARLAKEWGIGQVIQSENGMVIDLTDGKPQVAGYATAGYLAVEGSTLMPTDGAILKTRRKLKNAGVILVTAVVDEEGDPVTDPMVSAPGVLDPVQDEDLLQEIKSDVTGAIRARMKRGVKRPSETEVVDIIKAAARKVVRDALDKKPLVEVHLVAV